MPKFQVVFTNGEKRELTVQAHRIDFEKPGMIRFLNSGNRPSVAAVVPVERVLYILHLDDD